MKQNIEVIKIQNVTKSYKIGGEVTNALNGVDLTIHQGEFVAIMGPSGSGKSTLMHILGLLDTPTSGKYFLDGVDVSKLSGNKQSKLRNSKIGFVFQQFNLLPRTTVLDNVLLPTIYGNVKDAKNKAKKILKEVGLEERMYHKSNQISGGQTQRVAIARALITEPSVIMADEPTGNLDTKRSKEIMDLFTKINKDGATIVLITHEEDIAKYASRVIYIRDGKLITK